MTPGLWLTAIKDILVLVAVGFLVYLLVSYGGNRVEKKDLAQLTEQIKANADLVIQWHKEDSDANAKRDQSLAQLHADVATPRAPVIVRIPVSQAGAMPAAPSAAAGENPHGSGTPSGCGSASQEVNIRPDLDALEMKYGEALIKCRSILDKWPH